MQQDELKRFKLLWFGHVICRKADNAVNKAWVLQVDGKRSREDNGSE